MVVIQYIYTWVKAFTWHLNHSAYNPLFKLFCYGSTVIVTYSADPIWWFYEYMYLDTITDRRMSIEHVKCDII